MCGRYTITVTFEELLVRFHIDQGSGFHTPRYNIAPMQMVMAVIHGGKNNRLGELRWGLVPSWAKDEKLAASMINARAETLSEKPAFKRLVHRKRCIIPSDGFYEWRRNGKTKEPLRIVMRDREIFGMAGLYDTWMKSDGSKISTCTIITTTPNELMADIHDRMPVILRPEDEQAWLDRDNPDVLGMLRPYPADKMLAYPVSPRVGNVKNDDEECIKEVSETSRCG